MAKEKKQYRKFFVQGNHTYEKHYYSYVSDAVYYIVSMNKKFFNKKILL